MPHGLNLLQPTGAHVGSAVFNRGEVGHAHRVDAGKSKDLPLHLMAQCRAVEQAKRPGRRICREDQPRGASAKQRLRQAHAADARIKGEAGQESAVK